jgi:hypothetical protein
MPHSGNSRQQLYAVTDSFRQSFPKLFQILEVEEQIQLLHFLALLLSSLIRVHGSLTRANVRFCHKLSFRYMSKQWAGFRDRTHNSGLKIGCLFDSFLR